MPPAAPPPGERPLLLAASLLFALSGAAALVYQVAWQRILTLHSGVGVYSVAIIVAAFMAGLGLGSALGGSFSARLDPRRALVAFAGVELAVAGFALISCPLYYDALYLRWPGLFASLPRAAATHAVLLVLPTTLMGCSLPLLVRALVWNPARAPWVVGSLYGLNTLGAAAGALVTPWLLMRQLGVDGAVRVGACLTGLAGALALLLAVQWRDRGWGLPAAAAEACDPTPPQRRSFSLWLGLCALSGALALGLELVWFRILDVALKSNAFTFGTLLAVYLAGWGLGSLLGGRRALRSARPLRAFLLCQVLLMAWALGAVTLLVHLPLGDWLKDYWASPRGAALLGEAGGAVLALQFVLPAALLLVPTTLMGAGFAYLQRGVHERARASGRRVGLLVAANIAGAVAGSLGVGLGLLGTLGTSGSLRVLGLLAAGLALLGLREEGLRSLFAPLLALLLGLILAVPGTPRLWGRLHARDPEAAWVAEDASGVVLLAPEPTGGRWRLSVNGKLHSELPFGGLHSLLGAVPAVLHPAPRRVAIVGLGSGDTAWGASCRPETEAVTVFELCAPERTLLEQARADFPRLDAFLADPRLRLRIADGRNALARETTRYDLIEADALRPTSAGSGNLYSLEFFQLCGRRLRPGGFLCTWTPTPRIRATLRRAFPQLLEGPSFVIASNDPLRLDLAACDARLRALRPRLGAPLAEAVAQELRRLAPPPPQPEPAGEANRDLFPRDELQVPWR